ncbi:MAG: hypothetical protein CMJ68_01440 [Planctomycetaceae bacterium]|nr:hypothetical protein [Planctomycetaceae bacterium]
MNATDSSRPTSGNDQDSVEPLNPFFRITIVAGGLFVVTILAMIASALGPETASPAQAAFDENANWLLAAEVAAILASAVFAMAGDNRNLNDIHDQATDTTDANEPVHPATD